jgi:hypothetical protein
MGHEQIVRLYLEQPYYDGEIRQEERKTIIYAARGNQPRTLEILLQYFQQNALINDYLGRLNGALLKSSSTGAANSVRLLLIMVQILMRQMIILFHVYS